MSMNEIIDNEAFAPLASAQEPQWWLGSPVIDPLKYTIDGNEFRKQGAPLMPSGALGNRMQAIFNDVGLVHITNTGLADLDSMKGIASHVIKKQRRYEGGANPRKALRANVFEVGAPLEAWLHYHHEMAYIGSSTKMLGFLVHKMPKKGGYTFVSDNVRATEDILATPFGKKLKEKGLCYHRNLTDREQFKDKLDIGVYNHWQQSMLTEDPDVAIYEAKKRGLQAEWGANRLLKTRYYISAFEYFPQMDQNLLYSSMADDSTWFDTWPMVQHLPEDERPLKLTFGDDTEMSRDEKQQFLDVYDRYGFPLEWQVGDIGIICNFRFAHGRPAVHLQEGEERQLGVLIGDSYDRVQTYDDKW